MSTVYFFSFMKENLYINMHTQLSSFKCVIFIGNNALEDVPERNAQELKHNLKPTPIRKIMYNYMPGSRIF